MIMTADSKPGDDNLIQLTQEMGARLYARRKQMGMAADEVGGIIDLDAESVEAIEAGQRDISRSDLDGLLSYLCVTEEFLNGRQSLESVVAADQDEAGDMLAEMVAAFTKLPNQLARRVAFTELIDFLNGMAP